MQIEQKDSPMPHQRPAGLTRLTVLALPLAFALSACGMGERVGRIGKPPAMSQPYFMTVPNGAAAAAVQPPPALAHSASTPVLSSASLFRAENQSLFADHRARAVGDLMTINIDIADKAEFDTSTNRNRAGNESSGIGSLFGLEKLVRKIAGLDTSNLLSTNSGSTNSGSGKTSRSEKMALRMTAMVTQVMPNGTLVIRGSQESRLNYELRELTIIGLVRPVDIAPDNSIAHSKIAEMRFSYGGKGQLNDAGQARWGQQLIDAISPF